ncbi:hypothetical protein GLAREA_00054 [Glarea lozoyensis ATCC 20868]|uniref:Uncharacterized protein n=1 Tax=Glarea lozoyensis (strain ATCC 20868 / MF5171) TaxID=1116229 RepID=S3DAA3_GLAL2|nr:uncharacterized protein GLAREA_00054 [Glarea lozoyensis ATCC 20868]EPE28896.1 hypothetical protein GLAREA_00054 [Glarea lozoyensis ATCC 20868]
MRTRRKTQNTLAAQSPAGKRKLEVQTTYEGGFLLGVAELDRDAVDEVARVLKRPRYEPSDKISEIICGKNVVELSKGWNKMDKIFNKIPSEASSPARSSLQFLTVKESQANSHDLQVHQKIAERLPSDRDITNYSVVCPKTLVAIDPRFWRRFFMEKYDYPNNYDANKDPNGTKLYNLFRYRQSVLSSFTLFDLRNYRINDDIIGVQRNNQGEFLKVLHGMIIEMDSKMSYESGEYRLRGRNLDIIRSLVTNDGSGPYVDIIDSILSVDASNIRIAFEDRRINETLVFVLQLVLTAMSLHPNMCNSKVCHFDLSQLMTYATAAHQPVFKGKYKEQINALWLLYTANFFKFHLKSAGEGIMAHAYSNMDDHQYPSMWEGKIKAGTQPLQRFWKGAHTFLSMRDLISLRNENGDHENENIYSDSLDSHDQIFQVCIIMLLYGKGAKIREDMEILFSQEQASKLWSSKCEEALQSDPFINPRPRSPKKTKKSGKGAPSSSRTTRQTDKRNARPDDAKHLIKPEFLSFYGVAHDSRTAYFYGRIHALPPQQNIHGFQRIVLKKFYLDDYGEFSEDVYYYEGCVFPGGKVIAGRWWNANHDPRLIDTMSGPFLWWGVDESARAEPNDSEAILAFAALHHH